MRCCSLFISLLISCLLCSATAKAQNLLVNSGFEEENICSEFNINCAPEGWIYTVPSFIYYFKGGSRAHSGSRFVGLIAAHSRRPLYRTFVRSRLLCGLHKGARYRLQFYVRSVHPILDSLGVYFTPYDFLFTREAYPQNTPSQYIADASETVNKSDTNWQRVTMNYTATGNETYLTVGYFGKSGIKGTTGIERENNFFFFLDDVTLVPEDANEKLCPDWKTTREDIYEQNERHDFLEKEIQYRRYHPLTEITATPTLVQKIDTLIVPDVLFATGKVGLTPPSYALLDTLTYRINTASVDSLVVEGHTDNTGSVAVNEKLSAGRAASVAAYLKQKFGSPRFPLITRSWGSGKPAADNSTQRGRQQNRRVAIYMYTHD